MGAAHLSTRIHCPPRLVNNTPVRKERVQSVPSQKVLVQFLPPQECQFKEAQPHPQIRIPLVPKQAPENLASRRGFLSAWTSAAAVIGLSGLTPYPARGENVRLEDVESRELQQALEAAISGDLETAEVLFGRLIQSNSDSASMWSNRGSVRLSLGRFEEAVGDFTKAIELAPYAAVPFLNRAIALEALGQLDAAAKDCFSAIENDPHESAAFFNLGNIEVKRSRYQQALDAYQTAADLSPGIAGYRLREANVLFQVGFSTDAEKLVRSIVRKYPNYAEAHAALAGMLWGEGSLSLAEEQLTEAVEWEPNFKNFRWVSDNVQWPPKLLQAYQKFLTLK